MDMVHRIYTEDMNHSHSQVRFIFVVEENLADLPSTGKPRADP
jgi:hypothetical protein